MHRDLSDNLIKVITMGSFAQLGGLTQLCVNVIQQLKESSLLPHACRDLSNNTITSIENGAFIGLDSLTSLSVSIFTELQVLIFSSVWACRYLTNNQISSIESGDFSGLRSLSFLYGTVSLFIRRSLVEPLDTGALPTTIWHRLITGVSLVLAD